MSGIDYKQVREIEKNLDCSTYEAVDIYLKIVRNEIINKAFIRISNNLTDIEGILHSAFFPSLDNKHKDSALDNGHIVGVLNDIRIEIERVRHG